MLFHWLFPGFGNSECFYFSLKEENEKKKEVEAEAGSSDRWMFFLYVSALIKVFLALVCVTNVILLLSSQCDAAKEGAFQTHQVWHQHRPLWREEVSDLSTFIALRSRAPTFRSVVSFWQLPFPGGSSSCRSWTSCLLLPGWCQPVTCSATWGTPSWGWTPSSCTWRCRGAGHQVSG